MPEIAPIFCQKDRGSDKGGYLTGRQGDRGFDKQKALD